MSNPEQLDRELREYLEQEPNLRRDERLVVLKNIMHKHLEFNKLEHVINNYDLFSIISRSKSEYSSFKLPMKISRKQVDSSDLPHVAIIESVLSYLNKMSLLKRLVKFDYTE